MLGLSKDIVLAVGTEKNCIKVNHVAPLHGVYFTRLRHHSIRDLIGRGYRQSGFKLVFENIGNLKDGCRSADIIVKLWNFGKYLPIGFFIIYPSIEFQYQDFALYGIGAAVTGYEQVSRD